MSIGWVVVLFIAVLMALLLVVPFHFVVDSKEKRFSIRWFFLSLAFRFSDKRVEIGLFGIRFQMKKRGRPLPLPARLPKKKRLKRRKRDLRSSPFCCLTAL
ncbi:MAG: hypothetical protein MPW14_05350 [Candidatus Manganitrophus sp.]|nr:MAG: hypothetical protein MPW14_05350 [Candidatus Manganitrophus sp.]